MTNRDLRQQGINQSGMDILDAIVVSDIHINSSICEEKAFLGFLDKIISWKAPFKTQKLIICGDLFDSYNFDKITITQLRILEHLREIARNIEVIFILGNHENSCYAINQITGLDFVERSVILSGPYRILLLHGHEFDKFLNTHPMITWIGERIYGFLQWVDRSHKLAIWAKHKSKTFIHCSEQIEKYAIEEMNKQECHIVIAGHVHSPKESFPYCNSGSWTEKPATYLTIQDGLVSLKYWE